MEYMLEIKRDRFTNKEEIFISGVDDSVLNESLNFTEAIKKLDKFENRLV